MSRDLLLSGGPFLSGGLLSSGTLLEYRAQGRTSRSQTTTQGPPSHNQTTAEEDGQLPTQLGRQEHPAGPWGPSPFLARRLCRGGRLCETPLQNLAQVLTRLCQAIDQEIAKRRQVAAEGFCQVRTHLGCFSPGARPWGRLHSLARRLFRGGGFDGVLLGTTACRRCFRCLRREGHPVFRVHLGADR